MTKRGGLFVGSLSGSNLLDVATSRHLVMMKESRSGNRQQLGHRGTNPQWDDAKKGLEHVPSLPCSTAPNNIESHT